MLSFIKLSILLTLAKSMETYIKAKHTAIALFITLLIYILALKVVIFQLLCIRDFLLLSTRDIIYEIVLSKKKIKPIVLWAYSSPEKTANKLCFIHWCIACNPLQILAYLREWHVYIDWNLTLLASHYPMNTNKLSSKL
jgi:hypothetical protein